MPVLVIEDDSRLREFLQVSGFEVLGSLRATDPHLLRRIIVLTAVSQITLDHAFEYQPLVWQFLRKPFDVFELMAAITECANFHSTKWPTPENLSSWLDKRCFAVGAKASLIAVVMNGRELCLHASCGFAPGTLEECFPVTLTAPYPLCSAVRTGHPVWLASVVDGDSKAPLLSPVWTKSGSKAIAVIPLRRDQLVSGVIGWSFAEPQRFGDRQRAMMLGIARDSVSMVPFEQHGGYLQIS
jgi:hypothetical protein